jgi:hypothetical protein
MMMMVERMRQRIVFNVKPSDISANAIMAKMIVPVENPIILIGHIFPPKSSYANLDAMIAR